MMDTLRSNGPCRKTDMFGVDRPRQDVGCCVDIDQAKQVRLLNIFELQNVKRLIFLDLITADIL